MPSNGGRMIVFEDISEGIDRRANPSAAEEAFIQYALIILEDAKNEAPWTDRTGAARAGLDVEVDEEGGEISLTLFHTVEYGLYLETGFGGQYEIIIPTLEKFANQAFEAAGGRLVVGT